MTEFLSQHGLLGLTIGFLTFLLIGLFHPIVIKAHYYWGLGCRVWFLIAGLLAGAASLTVANVMWSTLLGVLAFTCLWSIHEITEQEARVARGWFPANPKRAAKSNPAPIKETAEE
ncbi:MAG: DUF4491 family protein [Firmicutes bacterium]|nr:DUF4491 family protein [Bacillota bacterium]MCM1401951.1 DUF4491 family protein [Bacteroides sp.]MCM1477976.1 DUF4491 family protein [Bacteroides sp.]